MRQKTLLYLLYASISLLLHGCDHSTQGLKPIDTLPQELIVTECNTNEDCGPGMLCLYNSCIEQNDFDCRGDQEPMLEIIRTQAAHERQTLVNFGNVFPDAPQNRTVYLRNIGECNLTINKIDFSENTDPGFYCDDCSHIKFPLKLVPEQSLPIQLEFTSNSPGGYNGDLMIQSNALNQQVTPLPPDLSEQELIDAMFYTTNAIHVKATYNGKPQLMLSPEYLDFGQMSYHPGKQDRSQPLHVNIANHGTGHADILVQRISLQPAIDSGFAFANEPGFILPTPNAPWVLAASNQVLFHDWLSIPLVFTPHARAVFNAHVVVEALDPSTSETVQMSIPLMGSSLGTPRIAVFPQPHELSFPAVIPGRARPSLLLGEQDEQVFTIHNKGTSDLHLFAVDVDNDSQFQIIHDFNNIIKAGHNTNIKVVFRPTEPTDANQPYNPETVTQTYVNISSNDQQSPVIRVLLQGLARAPEKHVLQIHMSFERNKSNFFALDFRQVDLVLENATWGQACGRDEKVYMKTPQGTYKPTVMRDSCADWINSLSGQVTWYDLNPQKIVLHSTDAGSTDLFNVKLHYTEDCAGVAKSALATTIGVVTSVSINALTEMPLLQPHLISELIKDNCWDHESNNAMVSMVVNGKIIATTRVFLQDKGDCMNAMQIRAKNGSFELINKSFKPCL